jgi:flagellar FliL protein
MGDEERFLEEEVAGEGQAEATQRPGIFSGVLINVLKWVAIGLAAVIVIGSVSWLTFSLFIRGREAQGVDIFSSERMREVEPELDYFKAELEDIRGQTSDDPPLTFMAKVSIGYKKGDQKVQAELVAEKDVIQNVILIYLGGKKASELTTRNLTALQNDLKQLIQSDVISPGMAIYKVLFRELQTF